MTSSSNTFNGRLNRFEMVRQKDRKKCEIDRRTTDFNVFYDKSLHPRKKYIAVHVSLVCMVDTFERENRAQVYEYRDETFKHDAFLVVLLSFRSHSKASFFHLSLCLLLFLQVRARDEEEEKRTILPHGMRICCSLSIDSFCDFYSHFLCVQKANHLPMCYVCALAPSQPSRIVYVVVIVVVDVIFVLYFSHNTPLCFLQSS